jgi:hypothetical protein
VEKLQRDAADRINVLVEKSRNNRA